MDSTTEEVRLDFSSRRRDFLFSKRPDMLRSPPGLLFKGCNDFFQVGNATGLMRLITSPSSVLVRINGAMPLLPIDNKSFERVKQFSYWRKTLTNPNFIHEEIKSRLKSGSACCLSVQKLWPSTLLSKIILLQIYKIIILPVVLYGCETWSLKLRVEHSPRVFANRVVSRYLGPRGTRWQGLEKIT